MRTLRVAVFLAVRSVTRGNYGIASLTTLMMLLIYLSLLFLPSLIQGSINRVNDQLVDTFTSDIVITPNTKAATIDGTAALVAAIRRTPGVEDTTAVLRVGTQVSYGSSSGSFTVEAIDPASYAQVFTTPSNMFEGRYLIQQDTDQALLGIGVAGAGQTHVRGYKASLETVHAGDLVSISLSDGQTVGFDVAGIYDNQFPLADGDAYITMNEAEQLLPGIADDSTAIYVRTDAGANVNQVVSALTPLQSGLRFETSADLGSAVHDQVATFNLISDILKIVSLLMAAITVFIITYVDLVNKRRQIGIQRAIGIRSSPIVLSYVFKAWLYALVGVGAGFLLFQYVLTTIVQSHPFQFPNGPVTLAATAGEMTADLVILVAVASIAALVPAVRSTRIRILDAIWGA